MERTKMEKIPLDHMIVEVSKKITKLENDQEKLKRENARLHQCKKMF